MGARGDRSDIKRDARAIVIWDGQYRTIDIKQSEGIQAIADGLVTIEALK